MSEIVHEEDCHGEVDEHGQCVDWCFHCNACEPQREGDFKVCSECLHVFRTPKELVDLHMTHLSHEQQAFRPAAADIATCPKCLHDF